MSEINHEVKISKYDLPFFADQLAQVEVLLNFVIDSIRTSKSFKGFQRKLEADLKQIKVTQTINVDEWLADQKEGVIVMVKPVTAYDSSGLPIEHEHPVDYWRDEEGFPIIYTPKANHFPDIDTNKYEIIRIIDLAEEHERKK